MASAGLRWRLRRRKWLHRLQRALLRGVEPQLRASLQLGLRRRMAEHQALRSSGAALPPLEETELKVFSQNGEDGILLYLLALTGWERRRFLEIGIQDGWECNCAVLAKHLAWDGWFVEGNADSAALARQQLDWDPIAGKRAVHVVNAYVTREEVPGLLAANGIADVDVLSVDIDGMDGWIWQALCAPDAPRRLQPRVTIVEYNAAFGPERAVTVPYRAVFDRFAAHPSGLYYGASLAGLARIGRRLGQRLVGCDSAGVNAFFVREDAAPAALRAVSPAEAFRENAFQNKFVAFDRQFAQIEHLPLEPIAE